MISRVLRSTELRVQAVRARRDGAAVHPGSGGDAGPHHRQPARHGLPRGVRAQAARGAASRITCRRRARAVPRSAAGRRLRVQRPPERAAASTSPATTCCAASSPAIPNAIAALLLYIRDETGRIPHAYFGWTEGNPIAYLLKFLAFGEGDTAPVTREVLRQSEPIRCGVRASTSGERVGTRSRACHVERRWIR